MGSESISFQGSITVANSSAMRLAIRTALRQRPTELVIDFSGVTYMDSSAVATLIEALRIANTQQTRLTIAGLGEQPRYLMDVIRLDRLFHITTLEANANS